MLVFLRFPCEVATEIGVSQSFAVVIVSVLTCRRCPNNRSWKVVKKLSGGAFSTKFWMVSGVSARFREFGEYFFGFWHVSGVSGMFLESVAHLESFWNGSFWNVSGVLEYVSEVLECFESFWHMSGVSGMFREFLG